MNELIVIEKPNSSVSEEIKKVRTNIKFADVNDDLKVIMITSSVPSEGKSFVSANLAASFAVNGERVLLVDCDLRKGRQKKIFEVGVGKTGGLSNLLIDKEWEDSLKTYIKKSKVNNLFLIPSGAYPPNPSELLASKRAKQIIKQLRNIFDIIILDCPPLVGLNDALVVSSYADMSLIVAKYKKTSIDLLNKSKKSLEAVGAKKINVILNQIDAKDNSYYYYGTYGKYYSE